MSQTRRLAAILAADVAGYSRLMGADEEGTLERLKALRRELLDPKIAEHHGRIVKTTGDGLLVEFASVVDAVRCAVAVQQAMPERNTGVAADNRIELRIGINLGDVIVEGDAPLWRRRQHRGADRSPGRCRRSVRLNTVHDHVRDRLPFVFEDLGEQQVKNIARPVRVYRVRDTGAAAKAASATGAAAPRQAVDRGAALRQYERRSGAGIFRRRHGRGDHHRALPHPLAVRHRPQFDLHLQGPSRRRETGRARARRALRARRLGAQRPATGCASPGS